MSSANAFSLVLGFEDRLFRPARSVRGEGPGIKPFAKGGRGAGTLPCAPSARRAAASRSAFSCARGSGRAPSSASFISATKRLGTPATVSRPRLRRASVLTTRVARARVMPTYIRRRSSSMRTAAACSSSPSLPRNGSSPSLTPASTTCGHSSPLAACSVDSVTTFWSSPRSARLTITEIDCATSSTLFASTSSPVAAAPVPPQRRAIQSTKSSTLVQRAAASGGESASSCRCCS